MARGQNPNSKKALEENRAKGQFRGERAVKAGAKGNEVRRQLRTFQQLDAELTTDEERAAMLNVLKKKAMDGDTRAWEIYAQYMGMKPTDKVDVRATSSFDDFINEISGQ